MNIFVVDECPITAAQSLCDAHVVKMVLETAQILSSVARRHGDASAVLYKSSYTSHPCVLWAGDAVGNWEWLLSHGLALCEEFELRYKKAHSSAEVIDYCAEYVLGPVHGPESTPFIQCVPDQYRGRNTVEAYRAYYIGSKSSFAEWNHGRNPPEWYTSAVEQKRGM